MSCGVIHLVEVFCGSILTCACFRSENILVSLIHTNTSEELLKNLMDSDMHCITSQVHSTCHYKTISGNTQNFTQHYIYPVDMTHHWSLVHVSYRACFIRAEDLRLKQDQLMTRKTDLKKYGVEDKNLEVLSSSDELDFNEFLDWRAKIL